MNKRLKMTLNYKSDAMIKKIIKIQKSKKVEIPPKNLHAGLGIGIVCRFKLDVGNADAAEEVRHDADEVAQRQVPVDDHALDLVELRQVRGVGRFVAEHAVDSADLRGFKSIFANFMFWSNFSFFG